MNKKERRWALWIAIVITVLAVLVLTPSTASYVVSDETIQKTDLQQKREDWLAKLEMCESSGNPKAVNPRDLDGTPSYGLLQFKPSTFEMYSKRYSIEGELMDPEAQRALVRAMMDDERVRWHREFPACVERLGRPPVL
jgi:hypothetical protein